MNDHTTEELWGTDTSADDLHGVLAPLELWTIEDFSDLLPAG